MQAFALSNEERCAEILLELAYSRCDVRLHAMQPFSRARDSAFAHHGAENAEIRQVHPSLPKMFFILFIHFM